MMAAGAAGGLSGLVAGAASAAPATALPFRLIVADRRFPASLAFAAEAARSGARIGLIDGDITRLWYDELDLRWRDDKAVLAGLTGYGAFFYLERLALDRGLRLAFKGEHRLTVSGAVSHAISGDDAVAARDALAPVSGRAWAAQTARLAMAASGAGPIAVRLNRTTQAEPGQPPLLISWVIAPRPERRS